MADSKQGLSDINIEDVPSLNYRKVRHIIDQFKTKLDDGTIHREIEKRIVNGIETSISINIAVDNTIFPERHTVNNWAFNRTIKVIDSYSQREYLRERVIANYIPRKCRNIINKKINSIIEDVNRGFRAKLKYIPVVISHDVQITTCRAGRETPHHRLPIIRFPRNYAGEVSYVIDIKPKVKHCCLMM